MKNPTSKDVEIENEIGNKTVNNRTSIDDIDNSIIIENETCLSRLEVTWSNVSISNIDKKDKKKVKPILENVSGCLKSGETLAIIGPSGSGKSTFLNFLSKKIDLSHLFTAGNILINSTQLTNDELSSIISYILKDDRLEQELTPKETFLFTAKLKQPSTPRLLIEERVRSIITLLQLENYQDLRISQIKDKERRLVSLGVELLSETKIILLDEPTSEMDFSSAYQLIVTLNTIAKAENKMIIFSIHSPSSEIFELISKFFVLAQGKTVYYGDKPGLFQYFTDVQLEIPDEYNPFEFIIEKISESAIENKEVLSKYSQLSQVESNSERYSQYIDILSKNYTENFMTSQILPSKQSKLPSQIRETMTNKVKTSFVYQMLMLLSRILIITMRTKKILKMKLMSCTFFSFVILLVFYNIQNNMTGMKDRFGVINLASLICLFGGINSNVAYLIEDRNMLLRERSINLYSISAYYLSKILGIIPISLMPMGILTAIVYYLTSLNDLSGLKFWMYYLILQFCYLSVGMKAFFYAGLSNNTSMILLCSNILNIPLISLSGSLSVESNFVLHTIYLKYISHFRWNFQMLTINQFSESSIVCVNPPINCNPLNNYKFQESLEVNFIVVGCLGLLMGVIGFVLFKLRVKNKVKFD